MPSTVTELFERSTSVLHFDDDTTASATELADRGRDLAARWSQAGLRPGDRVAIHLPNGRAYVERLLACAAGGFVAVSVNTRYTADEVASLEVRSGARRPPADGSPPRVADRPVDRPVRPDDPYVVFTTSGTTNRPKMVVHSQRSIAEHAGDAARAFGYGATDTAMVVMPLCGTFGLTSLTAAIAGDCSVVLGDHDTARTATAIVRHGVTVVNGSDDMFHRLVAHGADLTTIRLGGYARFNTSLDRVVGDAEAAGARLTGLYGMSEVQALFTLRDPSLGAGDRARAGGTLVSPLADYRIVDGELQVRGPSLMLGYLAEGGDGLDAELTAAGHDDGWFRTGDVADGEGGRTFVFVTRRGDAMRLGGFLVDPSQVESVIVELTGAAAQVVAVDRPDGARPVAFVVAPPDSVDEAAVIAACRDRLAIHQTPIRVFALDRFPTTPSANGTKIKRADLRELAAKLLADQP